MPKAPKYGPSSNANAPVADRLQYPSAITTPVPTITGSKGGNVALANLLSVLANAGLIIDSTT